MSMLKLPPNTTSDRHPERRLHQPRPRHLGTWCFLVMTHGGRLRLEHTRRGVNLFWRRVPGEGMGATWHMFNVLNDYRGLRAVQRGQEIFEHYLPIATDDDPDVYFVCSLPPGIYVITPRTDAEGEVLWYFDPCYVDDPEIALPQLESELKGRVQLGVRPVAREIKKAPIAKATLKPKPIIKAKLRP